MAWAGEGRQGWDGDGLGKGHPRLLSGLLDHLRHHTPRSPAQVRADGCSSLYPPPTHPRDVSSHPSLSPIPPGGEKAGFLRSQRAQAPSRGAVGALLPTLPPPQSRLWLCFPNNPAREPQFPPARNRKMRAAPHHPGPGSLQTSRLDPSSCWTPPVLQRR